MLILTGPVVYFAASASAIMAKSTLKNDHNVFGNNYKVSRPVVGTQIDTDYIGDTI